MLYYATFTSGLQTVAQEILTAKDHGTKIVMLLDGAVVFEKKHGSAILPCFINVFDVIHLWRRNRQSINNLMLDVLDMRLQINSHKHSRTFRIVTSVENNLVSVDNNIKGQVERRICRDTRLAANRAGADEEYWFLMRSENISLFMRRLTRHKSYDKIMRKGELHPDICYFMAWLSGCRSDDTVLDPFCGYGAIPLCVAEYFQFGHLYLSDNDQMKVRFVRNRFNGYKHVETLPIDALKLSRSMPGHSIDKIITDPPWGLFNDDGTDYLSFYELIFLQFLQVLKADAIIVLLSARKREVEAVCAKYNTDVRINNCYNVLVSGKKASIFVIQVISKYEI